MIEKMFDILPDWAQNKIVVRMVYAGGSFTAARFTAFLTGDYLAKILNLIVSNANHIGIHLKIQVLSVDRPTLQTAITGIYLVALQWVVEEFHSKKVIPVVTEKK